MFSDHMLCCGNVHTLGVFLLYILNVVPVEKFLCSRKLIFLLKMAEYRTSKNRIVNQKAGI